MIGFQLFRLYSAFQSFKDREEGQALVEYALILALVAIAVTASLAALSSGIKSELTKVTSKL